MDKGVASKVRRGLSSVARVMAAVLVFEGILINFSAGYDWLRVRYP